jgi:hypothetical protein
MQPHQTPARFLCLPVLPCRWCQCSAVMGECVVCPSRACVDCGTLGLAREETRCARCARKRRMA